MTDSLSDRPARPPPECGRSNQFAGIAEQMGVTLRNTATRVNVKERLDFSCAVFSTTGDLVVNAPHIPVHLGAMGETVRQILADKALLRLGERYSLPVVEAYMGHIQEAAEQKMRGAIGRLPRGQHRFVDHLDDGSPIAVTITVAGDQATLAFTGTGPVLAGNLNANRARVTAATMYCLRCLIREDIPLNQEVLAPIRLILPPGLLNPPQGDTPERSPAVVGGNVETAQRVVGVI